MTAATTATAIATSTWMRLGAPFCLWLLMRTHPSTTCGGARRTHARYTQIHTLTFACKTFWWSQSVGFSNVSTIYCVDDVVVVAAVDDENVLCGRWNGNPFAVYTLEIQSEGECIKSHEAFGVNNTDEFGPKHLNCCWNRTDRRFDPPSSWPCSISPFALAELSTFISCLCLRACRRAYVLFAAIQIDSFTLTQIKSTGTNSMCYFRLLSFYFIRMRACNVVPHEHMKLYANQQQPTIQTTRHNIPYHTIPYA